MKRAKDDKEREYIAAIALLDIAISEIPKLVPRDNPLLIQHLLDCRDHVISILRHANIEIPKR